MLNRHPKKISSPGKSSCRGTKTVTQPINDQAFKTDGRTIATEVLIIGGGVTGTGIMRDLALRGVHTLLIDKRDLCAGASGGNHGLLHSGARYVANDLHSAIECRVENELLKKLAPQCIEKTGGMFVAVQGDDPEFAEKFKRDNPIFFVPPYLSIWVAIPSANQTIGAGR